MKHAKPWIVWWLTAVLLLVGTIVWSAGLEAHQLPTADIHADAEYYYVYLPAILRGDLDFTIEYRETHNWYEFHDTPTGHRGNVFGIGPAVVSAPLFLLGHAIARLTGARTDGFSVWEVRLFTWASLPWSLGAVLVAYRLVRRRVGGGVLALAGPLMAALASPVVYYAVRQPGYSHPMATFFAALLVERWDASYDASKPRSLRTWVVLGVLIGASALIRPQLGLWSILALPAVLDDWRARRSLAGWRSKLPLRWAAGGTVAFIAFTPQLSAWKVLYGHWFVVPQGPHFMRWDAPCWSEVLFSSRNGLLPWSPAYLFFGGALLAGFRRSPRLTGGLLAGVVLQVVANGAVWDWWAGGSFGGRRFDSTYVAFAFGAGVLVAWAAQAVTQAIRRGARTAERMPGVAAALVMATVLQLVGVNLWLVDYYVVTSARIDGGDAAADVISDIVRGPSARLAAWLSALSNLPARAAFAWRHGASLGDYDHVVGVHLLGDTYPGLNGDHDETAASIDVHNPASPLLVGLAPAAGDAARIVDGRARVLVVLNRLNVIRLRIRVDGKGEATVLWDGRAVVQQTLHPGAMLTFRTDELRRGANDLVIQAPPGTVIHPIEVSVQNE
jgi:hypothetical protein